MYSDKTVRQFFSILSHIPGVLKPGSEIPESARSQNSKKCYYLAYRSDGKRLNLNGAGFWEEILDSGKIFLSFLPGRLHEIVTEVMKAKNNCDFSQQFSCFEELLWERKTIIIWLQIFLWPSVGNELVIKGGCRDPEIRPSQRHKQFFSLSQGGRRDCLNRLGRVSKPYLRNPSINTPLVCERK